jgi:hypothetical protein
VEGPYRKPQPLADIIPPDRRRLKLFAIVVSSMIAGAALLVIARCAVSELSKPPNATLRETPLTTLSRITPTTLHGPDGSQPIPSERAKTVVHVWLQGCQDCMPAFEALREIEDSGGLRVDAPVINVAYGEADPDWAARYAARENLVYDPSGRAASFIAIGPIGRATWSAFGASSAPRPTKTAAPSSTVAIPWPRAAPPPGVRPKSTSSASP